MRPELGRSGPGIGESFDGRPMPDLDSEAVELRAASESFAQIRKLRKRGLETLRLVTQHRGRKDADIAWGLSATTTRCRAVDELRQREDAVVEVERVVDGTVPFVREKVVAENSVARHRRNCMIDLQMNVARWRP